MNRRFYVILTVVVAFLSVLIYNSAYSATEPGVNTSESTITASSATLKGVIKDTGKKKITAYGFKWGTSKELDQDKKLGTSLEADQAFATTISGLKPGTTYYYQAYAINAKGKSYGQIKTFTVPAKHKDIAAVTATKPSDAQNADGEKTVALAQNEAQNVVQYSTPSRSGNTANRYKYPRLSKVNGSFGQFAYRDLSGGRIEVDPDWIANNIATITLPGLNQRVQVNKAAAPNFIHAFNLIKNGTATINGRQVPLLSLIKTMDGTFVTRHVNWNPSRGLSNHSWGTAIDINANGHFGYVDPLNVNDPNLILWEKAFKPAGFSWGNRYSDSMHYELIR
jgi:hypothetical protein